MRYLIFDAGPVITLTLNNLLGTLGDLKSRFKGKFAITPGVKRELIDKPLNTKKFEFEALQIIRAIRKKYIEVLEDNTLESRTMELLEIANNIYYSKRHPIKILDYGEIESLVASIKYKADAMVVDERTMRTIIEKPDALAEILRNKLHRRIDVDKTALREFKEQVGDLRMIRSVELVTVAFQLGLLDLYIPNEIPNGRRKLLDALLWGVKLNGCAVNAKEMREILRMVK